MTDTNVAFATADHWEEHWSSGGTYVEFDPQGPSFCDLHKLFQKHLPQRPGARLLEVGCYPGRYLWYFHKYFGYSVEGMEYVKSCASRCQDLMEQRGVPANIFHADFFKFTVDNPENRWDVVASFGLIEHFSDTRDVVERHLRFDPTWRIPRSADPQPCRVERHNNEVGRLRDVQGSQFDGLPKNG